MRGRGEGSAGMRAEKGGQARGGEARHSFGREGGPRFDAGRARSAESPTRDVKYRSQVRELDKLTKAERTKEANQRSVEKARFFLKDEERKMKALFSGEKASGSGRKNCLEDPYIAWVFRLMRYFSRERLAG